jgi:serine/threonine protein kinase
VRFKHKHHQTNHKVLTVDEAIHFYKQHYRGASKGLDKHRLETWQRAQKKYWESLAQKLGKAPKRDRLDRFRILQRFPGADRSHEYKAIDEPPSKVEVHLKEFLFDPLLGGKALEAYLVEVTREMQLLRKLRHPYLSCVVGHFRTGWSLVQVSDWFDGQPLSELLEELGQATLPEVLRLMIPVAQALAYCHEKHVFHRNLDAAQVLVAPDWDDVRLKGFALAKEADRTGTVPTDRLAQRDPRLIPPEELARRVDHYGRYDVYQLGILYYRMLEGGVWPWAAGGGVTVRPMTGHEEEPGIAAVRQLVHAMIAQDPEDRPFPMDSVEEILRHAQSG